MKLTAASGTIASISATVRTPGTLSMTPYDCNSRIHAALRRANTARPWLLWTTTGPYTVRSWVTVWSGPPLTFKVRSIRSKRRISEPNRYSSGPTRSKKKMSSVSATPLVRAQAAWGV
ncbi:MAG: hypothetical protein SNJ61_11020 [Fimbriimonadaceae bacterium]